MLIYLGCERGDREAEAERLAARVARFRMFEDDAGLTRLRLQGMSPLMTCVATLAVAVVVCGFAYPLAAMVFSPNPVPVLLIAITAVAGDE